MKDGCPMDEDALGGDSGAKISVVYMDSEDVSFPLEIKKLQSKNINMGNFSRKIAGYNGLQFSCPGIAKFLRIIIYQERNGFQKWQIYFTV